MSQSLAVDVVDSRVADSTKPRVSPRERTRANVQADGDARIINPLVGDEWDRLIAEQADATAFHTSAWCRVLNATYGHKPFYLETAEANRQSVLLPLLEIRSRVTGRRGVSLPFSDFCSPLSNSQIDPNLLVKELSKLATKRNWNYFELRGKANLEDTTPSAAKFYGHVLDLTVGCEKIEERFAPNVHRNLRKAERSDIEVRITKSKEAVLQFYQLLTRTRRRHGVPPQPMKFFRNIHRHLIDADLGFTALAYRSGRAIAGAMFFRYANNALYKFGASDEREQEFRANNLVMREAIRHLAASGARSLHFGRTDLANKGLRRFKLAWGAEEEMINYFRFQPSTHRWVADEQGLAGRTAFIFRNLPLAANRLIGTMAYPHLD